MTRSLSRKLRMIALFSLLAMFVFCHYCQAEEAPVQPNIVEDHIFFLGDFSKEGGYTIGSGAFSKPSNGGTKTLQKEENGNGYLEIKNAPGKNLCLTNIMFFSHRPMVGLTYKMTFRAKGKGTIRFSMSPSVEFSTYGAKEFDDTTLTEDWQTIERTIDLSELTPDRFSMGLALIGEDAIVNLDDLKIWLDRDANTKIIPEPGCPVLPGNSQVPEQKFQVEPPNLSGHFIHFFPDGHTERTPATAQNGVVTYPAFTLTPGLHRLGFAANGNSDFRDLISADEETIARLKAAAAKIVLTKNEHWLFLADSLTDFYRKHNHVDILAYFINQANPKYKLTYRNAACGGDQAGRIDARLFNGPDVYRSYMYNGLFDVTYDRVCVFLGQNDTVAFKATDYQKPQFTPEHTDAKLRHFLPYVQEKSGGAQMIIYSGVSTPTEVNDKLAASIGYKFGIPALVEQFNAVVQKVVADNGYVYFDIYTPLQALNGEKAKYYRTDGVHLSQLGHYFAAEKEMEFFATLNGQ